VARPRVPCASPKQGYQWERQQSGPSLADCLIPQADARVIRADTLNEALRLCCRMSTTNDNRPSAQNLTLIYKREIARCVCGPARPTWVHQPPAPPRRGFFFPQCSADLRRRFRGRALATPPDLGDSVPGGAYCNSLWPSGAISTSWHTSGPLKIIMWVAHRDEVPNARIVHVP
jgi:hypothetical protein